MALAENQLIELTKRFVDRLRQDIPVEDVLLFGSYARGTMTDTSDIDLAIVSSAFESGKSIDNMQFLSRVAARYSSLIEAIPLTPAEFHHPDSRTIAGVIVKSGRSLLR